MAKFYTAYGEKRPTEPTCAGNRYEKTYRELYDETGHPYLEETGQIDTYDKIQSYRDECDIQYILQRYAAGDQSVLNTPGYYMDTTKIPENFHEAYNFMQEQREKFKTLPLEVRQKFGNSFEAWAAAAGTEDWVRKMGLNKTEETTEKNEVVENEQKQ